jgi:hypothetical protein
MIRFTGLSALITFLVITTGFAQEETAPPPRKVAHYVGIQANQLIRQLFSLSNSNSAINNPYLMTYQVNSLETRVGLNIGLGMNIDQFNDDIGTLRRESKISDIFFRIGIEKKTYLAKKWILSAGFDIVVDNQSNSTKTFDPINPNNTQAETKNKTSGVGIGPRCGLYFHINDKILLGTEASYYLKSLKTTSEFKSSFTSPEVNSSDIKRFQLVVPAVIFLVLKL